MESWLVLLMIILVSIPVILTCALCLLMTICNIVSYRRKKHLIYNSKTAKTRLIGHKTVPAPAVVSVGMTDEEQINDFMYCYFNGTDAQDLV